MFTPTSVQSQANEVFDLYHSFDSSAIREAWYSTSENSLVIAPHHGGYYQYLNVPREEWEALLSAWSAGRQWQEIKKVYGQSRPLSDAPKWTPNDFRITPDTIATATTKATQYKVTVQVSGTFEIAVQAPNFFEALSEVEDDLQEKFQGLGIAYEVLGAVKA